VIPRLLRLFVPLVAGLGLLAQAYIYSVPLADAPIRSDGISYHVYLPSLVLHGSPRLWPVADDQYGGAFPEHTGILRWPNTSWWLNPHPIGAAIFMLPFFLLAHALTLWSNLPPDGFSLYYQAAASISGLVYGVAGLAILQHVLRRHFSDAVTLSTLAVVTFGTNLFHYLTFDATFSHAYGVFLAAALLWVLQRFDDRPTTSHAVWLGLVIGALFLVRHSHLLLVLLVALRAPGRLWAQRRALLVAAGVSLLVALPQLAIYKAVTGHWVISPYSLLPATMHFGAPEITGVLFWLPKGLLFWSPVLWLVPLGLALVRGPFAVLRLPTIIIVALQAWLIGAWYDWQFGGSFGHRGFTDLLPVSAVFIAAALSRIAEFGKTMRVAVGVVVAVLVAVSCWQMWLYWHGALPFRDTTWEMYRSVVWGWL
jgi:hypothetical protein